MSLSVYHDSVAHRIGQEFRLARRAAHLAIEEQRKSGRIKNPLDSSIALYTDDPSTAGLFYLDGDMPQICGTSSIEFVAIVMGDDFPPSAHEAERDDTEPPRVAAMFFNAVGDECARCRKYVVRHDGVICDRCTSIAGAGE